MDKRDVRQIKNYIRHSQTNVGENWISIEKLQKDVFSRWKRLCSGRWIKFTLLDGNNGNEKYWM